MLDLTVIILTYNEEIHIRRCLENVCPIAKKVIVVDSPSTDSTVDICHEFDNVEVVVHKYPGNQAEQFNWAIDNVKIDTQWVLRLDADEYLLPELIEELKVKLPSLPDDVNGVIFNRRHIFMGKWMKRGIYPVKLLRVFRYGKGRCEQRLMDEHIQLYEGRSVEFDNDFCDHNLNDLSWFCHKHVNYATREAVDMLDIEFDLTGAASTDDNKNISRQAQAKRMKKHKYAKQPLFWRAFAYFCYRYFLKGACLDGKAGFIWTFLQGWWYRTLVDAKIYEVKKACGNDKDAIKKFIRDKWGLSI
ncbi:MAG: glycosyltransferase family 2 protein [Bacteroidales bacterium]|nr:glycosyltransferase family 2 protein [Bacteroidales bacterium]